MNKNIIELLDASLNQKDEQKASADERGPRSNDPADKKYIELYLSAKGRNIVRLIETAINYIGQEVLHQSEEVLHQSEEVKLSWSHIETYLKVKVPDGHDLHGIIDFTFRSLMSKIDPVNSKGLFHIAFKGAHEQIALAYVDFLRPILLLRIPEYPKVVNGDVVLKEEQLFFCRRFVTNKNGKIVLRDPSSVLNHDMLLKTLRADDFDFSYQFILGIIPGDKGTRRLQNLRPKNRQTYVVTPKGTIETRLYKQPTHTPEEKAGFSQVQSCTLIDRQLLSPAFGFTRDRNDKLYGLMTDSRDALITRLLINDSGTVSRIFDHDSQNSAERSWSYHAYNADKKEKLFFSKNEIDDFKVKNIEIRPKSTSTNELLARLRFNPYRSVVSICSDTLESRLLAYDFAQELVEYFAGYAEKMGATLNPTFQLPIIFYVERSVRSWLVFKKSLGHDIKLYTDEMRQKDQAEALAIYNNSYLRKEKYVSNDYEFLLGLPKITLEILLEPVVCSRSKNSDVPLALSMMRSSYVRMLMRLLRHCEGSQSNLREELVDSIVKTKLIVQNDLAISELILAEQFDIADKFIAETQSCISELSGGNRSYHSTLANYLLVNGNPRQIKYARLDQAWFQSPISIKNWVLIKLFIKEHTDLPPTFLGELLCIACSTKENNAANFLLENGAPTTAFNTALVGLSAEEALLKGSIAPISFAAKEKNWELVSLFAQYFSDAEDKSEYGYALLEAVSDGQVELATLLLQAGAKATWRNNPSYPLECRLRSALCIAIQQGFDALLPQLIAHEITHIDTYSVHRSAQALKLAHEKGNHTAVELIQQRLGPIDLNDPVDQEAIIYQLVLEAYITEGRPLAKKRLLNYCQQHQLMPNDNDLTAYAREWLVNLLQRQFNLKDSKHVIDGLRIILPYFRPAQLKDRCGEVLIDFVLKNTVESLEPQGNFPTPGCLTLLPNDVVGKIVISGILESLPPLVRAALREETKIENAAETMSMAPISMAAKAKEWELVQRIIDYPTDAEDRSEYGYALFVALQNGLVTLARLLLAAGAKPTWRNNPCLSKLQSTLWVAIDLGFNELLPELIEHEKKYHDEHFLLRIECALEHAHEKGNQQAIHILQEEWGPITLFDDTNITASICQRVLVALRIEGEAIAKERMLNYLQQYRLLPDDNDLTAPVHEWRVGLFQHHVSHYDYVSRYQCESPFSEAVKLIMPSISPTEIKIRCTSALIDWVLKNTLESIRQKKEPTLSALITDVSRLNDQDTLKNVGCSVIQGIVKTLPVSSWDALKEKDENAAQSVGITPICRAAIANEWAFIRQFIEYPTDTDDRFEYGYALFAALSAGQVELAKLLLQAGAKPTWRNNSDYPLESKLKSTLWIALERGLNELLPQLIEYEKNYLDAHTMLGFEHALELAHEKDNQEAISLIQDTLGPITLMDPTNIAASISRRVLVTLTIEGQHLAEKCLLNYCRQYQLLPDDKDLATHAQLWVAGLFQRQFIAKNACLVIEGLRIIMPHLCAVLITFPAADIRKMALKKMVRWVLLQNEPTLFGLMTAISRLEDHDTRNFFAQIVINTILRSHPIDITLIRGIIALNFSAGFGQEAWNTTLESLCDRIRSRRISGKILCPKHDDQALLLFELNPMMPEDLLSEIFDSAIHRCQHKIARAVVTRPNLSPETKNKMLNFALDTHLPAKSDRMISLMMRNNFTVTMEHLKKAPHCSDKATFFLLFDHIDKVEYSKSEYLWDFLVIFVPTFSEDLKIEKMLIALLGPSMMRHIVLIHWLMNYKDERDFPNLSRFYNDNDLGKKHYTSGVIADYKSINYKDQRIFAALNTYFSDSNILPKEDILIETYNTILSLIEFAPKQGQAKSTGFFSKTPPDPDKHSHSQCNENPSLTSYMKERRQNANKLYLYMQGLDQLLRKSEGILENVDANTPLQLRASSPYSLFPQ